MKTLDEILAANTYAELFVTGSKKELRNLLKNAHPDMNPSNTSKAEKAFIHINRLWKLKENPTAPASTTTPTASSDIITKKNQYHHLKPIRKSNGVQTYRGIDTNGNRVFLLVATHPKIGEALMEGVKNLKDIKRNLTDQFKEFFPETTDAFRIQQGASKLFGVAQTLPVRNYSLRQVQEDYPEGIDGRDVAWMYRRMLVAVGNMHDNGIGHGAPTLDSFLINPETHELQVTECQFSKALDSEIMMVPNDATNYYLNDKLITREKDLKILSATALALTNGSTPRELRTFLNGMTQIPTRYAQEALYEFDEVLREVYGPRKFHEFKMKRD